ncbi:MAG: LysM peptidoglycan-binding domain-containing protein, partial [Oscillospiraceae bacterium]
TGALEASDYTLPISQLLELDGADEAAQCEAELFCAQLECTPDPDAMPGEGRLLIEAQMTAMLRFFHPVELVGATDSYSTLYVTETQAQKLRIPKLLAAVSERAVVRAQVDAPDGLESVIDVWVTPQKGTVRFSDGAMAAACQLQFTVLGRFADVGPDCFLHSSEAVVPLSISGADAQTDFSPRFSVLSASAGLTGASLQMTCELLVTGTALGFEVRSVITELTVDQSQPKPFDSAVGLMICYAKAGDRIWDISKRYGALPAQVMADNGLTDETIAENTVLLIPTAAQPV